MIDPRMQIDVSSLPEHGYEHRATLWWGNVVMVMIEGSMLAMAAVTYFYLRENFPQWPPEPTDLPRLLPGTLCLLASLVASVPMFVAYRRAVTHERPKREVMPWLWATNVIAIVANIIRIWEFPALGCKWNEHAYGSITWTLLGLHWMHLFASMFETVVITIYLINHDLTPKKRVDINADMVYWYLVVVSQIMIYLVIYWTPRWL
jgi:cytochrome c oxidase subunit III